MLMLVSLSKTGHYRRIPKPRKSSIVLIVFIDLIEKEKSRARSPIFSFSFEVDFLS